MKVCTEVVHIKNGIVSQNPRLKFQQCERFCSVNTMNLLKLKLLPSVLVVKGTSLLQGLHAFAAFRNQPIMVQNSIYKNGRHIWRIIQSALSNTFSMNSRFICPLSEDPNDKMIPTSVQLCLGGKLNSLLLEETAEHIWSSRDQSSAPVKIVDSSDRKQFNFQTSFSLGTTLFIFARFY